MASFAAESLAAWTALIVTVLTAGAKLLGSYGRIRQSDEAALWERHGRLVDDLRTDNDRLRALLRERDRECEDLRDQLEKMWSEARRRWPRMTPPEDTPRLKPPPPKRPSQE